MDKEKMNARELAEKELEQVSGGKRDLSVIPGMTGTQDTLTITPGTLTTPPTRTPQINP